MKHVLILGATGSVGCSTLEVIQQYPDRFNVFAITAHANIEKLCQQIETFHPEYIVVTDLKKAEDMQHIIQQKSYNVQLLAGCDGLLEIAAHPKIDMVMSAIVGVAGLLPTMAAIEKGKTILLANKESLVVAGHWMMEAAEQASASILPIDSEHNAIFQCLPEQFCRGQLKQLGVEKVTLTASGGPFLSTPLESLKDMTPQEACAHPNWSMGKKISVDSATMMNKGLEVIEASYLFGLAAENIRVVIHPQSIVHSFVSYSDGSVIAQMGNPDMKTPIAHALAWPDRIQTNVEPLDIIKVSELRFYEPEEQRYPCLSLAYDALAQGAAMPAVLNAVNEVSVSAFLNQAIRFDQIAVMNTKIMKEFKTTQVHTLSDIMLLDAEVRKVAAKMIEGYTGTSHQEVSHV